MNRTRSILILLVACAAPWLLVARADSEPATVAADTAAGSAAKAVESPEDAIAHALRARVSVEFPETALRDVMAQLEKDWKIPILVDQKGLADHRGISSDLPLTLKVSGVSARSVLDLLLRPLDLDWLVRDEVVWIGPRESLELETKVYDVADLVGRLGPNGEQPEELDKLVEVISATIEPESWDEQGGNGSIKPCEMLGVRALVVRQLRREHEAIATLLDDIRQCQHDARPAGEP